MELFADIAIAVIFFSTILLQIERKNFTFAMTYGVQSLAVIALVIASSLHAPSIPLYTAILLMFAVKVVIAPRFFVSLVAKHGVTFSGTTYLSLPLTLIAAALLTVFAHSAVFLPLIALAPAEGAAVGLAITAMLLSFFLIANRRGTISQMVGILSLENSIVMLAVLAGLEQSPIFEIGIVFDLLVWVFVASSFVSMVYEHTGSIDPTTMKSLQE